MFRNTGYTGWLSSEILTAPVLSALPWIEHGFGTREGPRSQEGMATLRQIHSSLVLLADRDGLAGEGDALVTRQPGVMVSIRTADCLPILLADERTGAAAAVHAGWRGSAARIVQVTLERMRREFGTEASEVYAAIGPGIGGCCYHVGAEVRERFAIPGPGMLDLARENLRQLLDAGLAEDRIGMLQRCTACEPALFHSWRREKHAAGRMISFIGVKGKEVR